MTATRRRSGPLGLLRVHAWMILTAVVVTIGSATAFALTRSTTYVATAQVSLDPEQTGGTALRPEMASERQIALSGTVTTHAADVLGRARAEAVRGLAVSVVLDSSVLNIRYRAATDDEARAGAQAFTQSYVDYRNDVAGKRIARVVTWPDHAVSSGADLGLILAVGLVVGLALGVSAAWVWDRLSDRIRDSEELTDHSGLPVLGDIPRWKAPGQAAPPGREREAFGYLAARLASLVPERRGGHSIVVTSPVAGAGTTTVAFNTAVALAEQGRDVVLISADLRRSPLHELGDDPEAPGLRQVLAGQCSLESALSPTGWSRLSVLTVGMPSGAEGERLQPDRFAHLLDQLTVTSVVVVDAPAILDSADSLLLVDKADVLLLAGDLRSGRRRDIESAMRLMDGARPEVAGWVANLPRHPSWARQQRASETESVTGTWEATSARSARVAS